MIYAPYDYIYIHIYLVYWVDFVIVNKIFGQLFFCIASPKEIAIARFLLRNRNQLIGNRSQPITTRRVIFFVLESSNCTSIKYVP